jgi:hypothetical protein
MAGMLVAKSVVGDQPNRGLPASASDTTRLGTSFVQRARRDARRATVPDRHRRGAALALHVRLLHAEADSWTDAVLLGQAEFQTARVYLQGDLALRKQALANAGSIDRNLGRYGPPDPLI